MHTSTLDTLAGSGLDPAYVEDLVRPGTLTMSVVRSPHPHARITRIDAAAARGMEGVVAVLTAADFKPLLTGTHPVAPAFVAPTRASTSRTRTSA